MEHQEGLVNIRKQKVLDLQVNRCHGTSGSSGLRNIRKCRISGSVDLVGNNGTSGSVWYKWNIRFSGSAGSSGSAGLEWC
jgi:hypothetical protein